MDRRAVLGGGASIIATVVSGCLEYLVGDDGPVDRPGERDGTWTPRAIAETTDMADVLDEHREAADALAVASLIIDGDLENQSSMVELDPIETSPISPPSAKLITTDDELSSIAFDGATVRGGTAAHAYDDHSAMLADTDLQYAYIIMLTHPGTIDGKPMELDLVGILPGSIAYVELQGDAPIANDDQSYLTIARIGAWTPPDGLIVGMHAAGSNGADAGLFEYPEHE